MRFGIILAPSAARAFRILPARIRGHVRDTLERHLWYQPAKVSKSRIKRLRGLSRPQYRLPVDDIRVSYDVTQAVAEVLAIVRKAEAQAWLAHEGTAISGRGSGEG
jgi:mRNA interferase RelE/StbE